MYVYCFKKVTLFISGILRRLLIQRLQSDWLGYCTLSVICVHYLEVVQMVVTCSLLLMLQMKI